MLTPHGWLEVKGACGGRDGRRLAEILSRCYPQEAWTARDVARFAERTGNVVKTLALGDDGMVVGGLLYRVRPDAVQVARVAVLEGFRRCRAGAYAVRSLTGPTSPVRRGAYEARVHELNEAGLDFAARCGFTATGLVREHFPDGMDAYLFRLFKEAPNRPRVAVAAVGR